MSSPGTSCPPPARSGPRSTPISRTGTWNIDGNLNDSVAEANKGNGQWWLFNAYGQLTGDTVRVTPPSPGQQYTLQGIATLDRAKRQSRAIFGGASGAADVRFTHVDRKVFGGRVDVVLDRVRTGPAPVAAPARLEAEAGVLTGSAKRSNEFSFASGEVVTAVGDGPENALTLHVTAKQAGQHVLVVRYANAEKSIPTHYNPDPVARHADIAVNGQAARRVLFPTTFHFNQFGQRSKYAPDIDYVTVSPLIAPAG